MLFFAASASELSVEKNPATFPASEFVPEVISFSPENGSFELAPIRAEKV
jgi:hypothetical protein